MKVCLHYYIPKVVAVYWTRVAWYLNSNYCMYSCVFWAPHSLHAHNIQNTRELQLCWCIVHFRVVTFMCLLYMLTACTHLVHIVYVYTQLYTLFACTCNMHTLFACTYTCTYCLHAHVTQTHCLHACVTCTHCLHAHVTCTRCLYICT